MNADGGSFSRKISLGSVKKFLQLLHCKLAVSVCSPIIRPLFMRDSMYFFTVFSLPVYRNLKMDEPCNYHTFERLMADEEKRGQVQDPNSEGYAIYQGMIASLGCFVDNLRRFRKQISGMTERYLEPLGRRNSDAYADAYSRFYADMICVSAQILGEDFDQSFPMRVDFVPMMYPNETDRFLSQRRLPSTA